MEQWPTKLSPVPLESFYPEALKKQAEEFNARISEALSTRAKIEADEQRLHAIDPAELSGKDVSALRDIPVRQLRELATEATLYEDLDPLYQDLLFAVHAERDAAYTDHEVRKADIRERLASIGYIDAAPTLAIPGSIMPGWIFRHPEVLKAKARFEELNKRTGSPPRTFEPEWKLTQAGLEQIRSAL